MYVPSHQLTTCPMCYSSKTNCCAFLYPLKDRNAITGAGLEPTSTDYHVCCSTNWAKGPKSNTRNLERCVAKSAIKVTGLNPTTTKGRITLSDRSAKLCREKLAPLNFGVVLIRRIQSFGRLRPITIIGIEPNQTDTNQNRCEKTVTMLLYKRRLLAFVFCYKANYQFRSYTARL